MNLSTNPTYDVVQIHHEGSLVAEMYGGSFEERVRQATLLCAAPELLSSLEALIEGIDEWNESVEKIIGHFPDYQWNELEEARRVVAKARGEERDA